MISMTYPLGDIVVTVADDCSLVLIRSRGWNNKVENVPLRLPAKNDFSTGLI